jgi:predicted aminopeptidase
MRLRTAMLRVSAAGLAVGALALAWPESPLRYLMFQGYYQATLLAGREPLDAAMASGALTKKQQARLALVPEIKAFGQQIGLSATANYSTINLTWDHTIWNVSACEEFAFEPVTWWFPIVGEVPYLGYFERDDALVRLHQLAGEGYDARMRTAGAYSTLGWFEDPLLVSMLGWSEASLADTILHELTHATVWIPGSVSFNESLANFVGEQAARRYLVDKYGPDGKPVRQLEEREEDRLVYREFMHGVYGELEALYNDPRLTRDEKRREKARIFAALPMRIAQLDLHKRDAYVEQARGAWNNAKMMSFKRYNSSDERFDVILDAEGGDLRGFLERIERITRDAEDPAKAVKKAAKKIEQASRDMDGADPDRR